MPSFPSFDRGDVVIVDLGMMQKVRPCVVFSISNADSQRNMSVVVPMTTDARDSETEVAFPKPPWLKQPCVVSLIGIAGVDNAKIIRRIGRFDRAKFLEVENGLATMLGLRL